MSYNSGVIVLVISNHSPNYSLNNCTPFSPITITTILLLIIIIIIERFQMTVESNNVIAIGTLSD